MFHIGPIHLDSKALISLLIAAFGAFGGLFGLLRRYLDFRSEQLKKTQKEDSAESKISSSISVVDLITSFQEELADERDKSEAALLAKAETDRILEKVKSKAKTDEERYKRELTTSVFMAGQLQALFQSCPISIIVSDSDATIRQWNPAAEKLFGYKSAEAVGKPTVLIVPKEYEDAHNRGVNKVRLGSMLTMVGKTMRVKGMRKDGSVFPCYISLGSWVDTTETNWTAAFIFELEDRRKENNPPASVLERKRVDDTGS